MRRAARALSMTLGVSLSMLIPLTGCERAPQTGAEADSAAIRLTGAGSSFAAPLFNQWIKVFATKDPTIGLTYESVGSGEGIDRFLAGKIDIGATDAPLRPDEAARDAGKHLQLPVTGGMIAIAYNLPSVAATLNLPRDVYADIFAGRISKWSDPRIAAANPGVTLPFKLIQVVARQDSSGTTFAFTNHLAAISPGWAEGPGVGKHIDWPGGSMVARGNEGVAARIKITEGSIGYVEAGFAQRLGLPLAHLQNRTGDFVAPTVAAGQIALGGGSDAIPKDLAVEIPDPEGAGSYPIVTFTWALVRTNYGDPAKTAAAKTLMNWALTEGQAEAEALRYVPLPANIVQGAQAELQRMGG